MYDVTTYNHKIGFISILTKGQDEFWKCVQFRQISVQDF